MTEFDDLQLWVEQLKEERKKMIKEIDKLREENDKLKFALVDSVKLAAVVAFPDNHKDTNWSKVALSHMESMEKINVVDKAGYLEGIRSDAIVKFVKDWSFVKSNEVDIVEYAENYIENS